MTGSKWSTDNACLLRDKILICSSSFISFDSELVHWFQPPSTLWSVALDLQPQIFRGCPRRALLLGPRFFTTVDHWQSWAESCAVVASSIFLLASLSADLSSRTSAWRAAISPLSSATTAESMEYRQNIGRYLKVGFWESQRSTGVAILCTYNISGLQSPGWCRCSRRMCAAARSPSPSPIS